MFIHVYTSSYAMMGDWFQEWEWDLTTTARAQMVRVSVVEFRHKLLTLHLSFWGQRSRVLYRPRVEWTPRWAWWSWQIVWWTHSAACVVGKRYTWVQRTIRMWPLTYLHKHNQLKCSYCVRNLRKSLLPQSNLECTSWSYVCCVNHAMCRLSS